MTDATEKERARLWNEVRELKADLIVHKAATDTMRVERDGALSLLKEIRELCLFDDDDGQIGVSEDVTLPFEMFERICSALSPQGVIMTDVKHTAAEPNYDAEMALPVGKTCADCRHIKRCCGFGFSTPERTSCDFYPSRFGETP